MSDPVFPSTSSWLAFDDAASPAATIRLYGEPIAIIEAHSVAQVAPAFDLMRAWSAQGYHLAGFLAYEAGAAFNAHTPHRDGKLLWFGVFQGYAEVARDEWLATLPDASEARITKVEPRVSREAYLAKVERLLELIRAGDLYQANFTFQSDVHFSGAPLALFASLQRNQRARHAAIVSTGDQTILSLSPELFFERTGATVRCKPMKGTAARTHDVRRDAEIARDLATDPKQRAENLMIVDLMRNDLSRIAVPGTVTVPQLFEVETYPTLFQLVSTVTGICDSNLGSVDVLAGLFPCGSITGAPKVRAMQVIDELEQSPRGIYTGSIGYIEPDGAACFNVAIRTLCHRAGQEHMTLGLGSGVVADSDPADEWRECLAKARFVTTLMEEDHVIELVS